MGTQIKTLPSEDPTLPGVPPIGSSLNFRKTVRKLVPVLAERADRHDREGTFVHDNYDAMMAHGLFSALVPTELGGRGAGYAEVCDALRQLGQACGSTALALSMHTHLVAAAVWKYRHGKPGEKLLRKVAHDDLVLISTGAGDWLGSNGRLTPVEGGYRLSARKAFCSGSPRGSLFITSAVLQDRERGERVLHFPVPASAAGVVVLDDWDTMGMRGTGSHSVVFEDVFVPAESVALDRPRVGWHPAWNVVLTVAAPIYTAPYVGIAEAACELARNAARKSPRAYSPYLLGEMENELVVAQMALREMVANVEEFEFAPENGRANAALIRKTIASKASIAAVEKAMEVIGGSALARTRGFERLFRDVRGAPFHPLPEKPQTAFTGRLSLGLDPV